MSFKVICINDANKPNDIPSSQWIKKGVIYTVTQVAKLNMQQGKLGYKLAEVNLDGCAPYLYYAAERFGIIIDIKDQADNWAEKELERLLQEAEEESKVLK